MHTLPSRPPRHPARRRWLAAACGAAWLSACGDVPGPSPLRYTSGPGASASLRLAIHPLHNPGRLLEAFGPMAELLGRRADGRPIVVESSQDYAAYEDKIRARRAELLLPNPWQALIAMRHGYHVLAMAGDPDDFHGLFVVRRDSPLRALHDLRGRTVAYAAPTAVAGAMLPQWLLGTQGLVVGRDVRSLYVGSQESAILHAWSGSADAGATWPPPWRAFQRNQPDKAAELRVAWRTPTLPNNALMARDDLPAALQARLREALLQLHLDAAGAAALAPTPMARFFPADDGSYEPMRRFAERFEREIRPATEAR